MVSIIDYDAGNVRSVENILRVMGQEYRITSSAEEILSADRIILPGVGAFGDAMEKGTLKSEGIGMFRWITIFIQKRLEEGILLRNSLIREVLPTRLRPYKAMNSLLPLPS